MSLEYRVSSEYQALRLHSVVVQRVPVYGLPNVLAHAQH